MAKVSIVVPIYNVEKYLRRCLDSIMRQTLKDIEIICINDGSPDKCREICDEYTQKDSRIKVINKQNEGVSVAKNVGINLASAQYICFIDADDFIDENMLLKMYNTAEKKNCEVIMSGYKTYPDKNKIKPLYKLNVLSNPLELIKDNHYVHSHNDLCFTWRFLFKTNVIKYNNIEFDKEIKVGEDFIFNLKVLSKAAMMYVVDEPLYFYTIDNENSAMRSLYKAYLERSLSLQYEEKKRLSIETKLYNVKEYRKDMANYYINNMLPIVLRNIFNGPEVNKNEAIKRVLNYKMFRESFNEIGLNYKCSNYKEYIAYLALKYRIYPIAYKAINKQYKTD